MKFLTLLFVALMVATAMAKEKDTTSIETQEPTSKLIERGMNNDELSEKEKLELDQLKKRMETDPEFKREVETKLTEKINELPPSERKAAQKRLWGLGLGLALAFNPFFALALLGKRDVSSQLSSIKPTQKFELTPEMRSKMSERELKEFDEMKKKLETDPAFRREVEAKLTEKINQLPVEEQKEVKRFFGLFGLFNPLLTFLLLGKRDVSTVTDAQRLVDLTEKVDIEKKSVSSLSSSVEVEEIGDKKLAKRFWGLWGLGLGWGLGYPWGLGLWGKRSMEEGSNVEEMKTFDADLMKKREEEFNRFIEAEKRLAPEVYKREGAVISKEQVTEMKKRWWGLGYGYGLGLGYGWGLGYPWGYWGKRETMPTEKRDEFVNQEMMKANREVAYERFMKDL